MRTPAVLRFIPRAAMVVCLIPGFARCEEVSIDLDRPGDSHVNPRIGDEGFVIDVQAEGYLQKLEPTTVRIHTRQKGRWLRAKLEAGRYLASRFDSKNPRDFRLESTLKFDLAAGERRFSQERDAVQKELHRRTGGKDASGRARAQVLLDRIAALREENIKAGADPRGKASGHNPPLPRASFNFEKPEALERRLKEQCCWQSVAEVFKVTGFPPPDDADPPEFAASQAMAEEIRQALLGNRFTPKYLTEGQYHALERGSRYEFSAAFVPETPDAPFDGLWKTAPAVRLQDGLVKYVQLEGGLDHARGRTVGWWRIECETPGRVQAKMQSGAGDCFWTWVESPDPDTQYIRVLLHSPASIRYRLTASLGGAKGEELTIYDGPLDAPVKAPF